MTLDELILKLQALQVRGFGKLEVNVYIEHWKENDSWTPISEVSEFPSGDKPNEINIDCYT